MVSGFMSMKLTYFMSELRLVRSKGHLVSSFGTLRSYRAYRRTAVPTSEWRGPSKALGFILLNSRGMFVSADLVSLAFRQQYRYPDNWGASFPMFS
jgi:hypothetical protein